MKTKEQYIIELKEVIAKNSDVDGKPCYNEFGEPNAGSEIITLAYLEDPETDDATIKQIMSCANCDGAMCDLCSFGGNMSPSGYC